MCVPVVRHLIPLPFKDYQGGLPPSVRDTAPALALLGTPQAEVLEDRLWEQFGPLPQLVTICQLQWLPVGGYSSTEGGPPTDAGTAVRV